ncbi:MAG: plasmid pRiA4b ORF-3 family protein [Clostridiales bacterium]|nr:plasmid pRiA4b ORF-3 family protein [Clostridiales bacterium]
MKAQVYKFKIEYADFENIIWRDAEVSSNYTLAKLGYLVLAAFDTLAYHLFFLEYDGKHYEIDLDGELEEDNIDPTEIKLNSMNLGIGSEIMMTYDYGCEQVFKITLLEVRDMEKGTSTKYPKIIAGAGKGILDDIFSEDFREIIDEIDKTGKSEHIYMNAYGENENWDYRDFDIELLNESLKYEIETIRQAYEGQL